MLNDEELLQRYNTYRETGSYVAAATALGINEANVRRSVERAVRRGLTGEFKGGTLPPGYLMGKVTVQYNEDGTVKNEWQRQQPDIAEVNRIIDELIETMGSEITPLPEIILPAQFVQYEPGWVTLYPVVDVHLGLYAWAKESGANYDLEIAKGQFLASVSKLINMSPFSSEALIVVLGDFFHADNNRAETEHSHNHLDVDGRHDKVLHLGTELIIWMIDMALQKHEHVTVHVQRGNHDPYASKALSMALWFRYLDNPRVSVDRSPVDLWHFQWGKTMLSFTHGDKIKAENMPGAMAAYAPEIWGSTLYRYGYSGHYHKSRKGPLSDEANGAKWEIFPAFTAKDEWNYSMGHSAQREIVSITFDKNEGRQFSNFVDVR